MERKSCIFDRENFLETGMTCLSKINPSLYKNLKNSVKAIAFIIQYKQKMHLI